MATDVIRSYLVSLGFEVKGSELRQWENSLKDTQALTNNLAVRSAADLLKWQTGILGIFTTVSGAIIGTIDKVAMADQEYRLFGERMFMGTRQAREYKIALDALGQPIEAIAWDPELNKRFHELIALQERMGANEGGDAEANLKKIRDVRFEFTKAGVELTELTRLFTLTLFSKLGGGDDILESLKKANEWLVDNLPHLADELSTDLIPILKMTWDMLVGVGDVTKTLAADFTNLVGVISDDDDLKDQPLTWERFAEALGHVAHWLQVIEQLFLAVEKASTGILGAAITAGGDIVDTIRGKDTPESTARAGKTIRQQLRRAYNASGDFYASVFPDDALSGSAARVPATRGDRSLAGQARRLAGRISAETGVPADIIFAQWEHETGNFTNRGSTDLNNLAGIKTPGGKDYRNFPDLAEFGHYYATLLGEERYSGAKSAKTTDDFAAGLKKGGYFEDSLENYQKGMKRYAGAYAGGSAGGSTTVQIGDINIMQPNATPDQIKGAVIGAITEKAGKQTQRDLVQASGAYE